MVSIKAKSNPRRPSFKSSLRKLPKKRSKRHKKNRIQKMEQPWSHQTTMKMKKRTKRKMK